MHNLKIVFNQLGLIVLKKLLIKIVTIMERGFQIIHAQEVLGVVCFLNNIWNKNYLFSKELV